MVRFEESFKNSELFTKINTHLWTKQLIIFLAGYPFGRYFSKAKKVGESQSQNYFRLREPGDPTGSFSIC